MASKDKGQPDSPAAFPSLAPLIDQARVLGYTVEFREYCEDAETPGFLGMIGGCVVPHRKAIKVGTHGRNENDLHDILKHEIDHILGVAVEGEAVGTVGRCGGTRSAWGEKSAGAASKGEEIIDATIDR